MPQAYKMHDPPYTSSQFPYGIFVTSPSDFHKTMSHHRTEVPSNFMGLKPINNSSLQIE
jgi:hypothetical protein